MKCSKGNELDGCDGTERWKGVRRQPEPEKPGYQRVASSVLTVGTISLPAGLLRSAFSATTLVPPHRSARGGDRLTPHEDGEDDGNTGLTVSEKQRARAIFLL